MGGERRLNHDSSLSGPLDTVAPYREYVGHRPKVDTGGADVPTIPRIDACRYSGTLAFPPRYRHRVTGSVTARAHVAIRFNESAVSRMITPGNVTSHHAEVI